MQEQLISLETAKLAKEKGFNLNSPAFYGCDNPSSGREPNQLVLREWENWVNFGNEDSPQEGTAIYSASTQSLLQKWLREVHDIHIEVLIYEDEGIKSFECTIYSKLVEEEVYDEKTYPTYEEALEQALIESLKVIK